MSTPGSTFDVRVTIEDTSEAGKRLDRYLSEDLALCRRSQLKQRLIDLCCNSKPAKFSTRVFPGDRITGCILGPIQPDAPGQPVEFPVLREEPAYLVIDKPQGLVVHPGAGNPDGTVVNGLIWRYRDDPFFLSPADDAEDAVRPGIVHRLDKDTSGVMIIAKSIESHQHLVDQFMAGLVEKTYLAITRGTVRNNRGTVEGPIGRDPHHRRRFAITPEHGKPAWTDYRVLRRAGGYTLVLLTPRTGRTHQLRVHLASLGNPILGDPLYARRDQRFPEATLMLHALSLVIAPQPGVPAKRFRAPVPDRFRTVLRELPRT